MGVYLLNKSLVCKTALRVVLNLQIRSGRKPDGVCLVVGSCARGFSNNSTSDVIYSSSFVKKVGSSEVQLFWEVTLTLSIQEHPKEDFMFIFKYK